MLLDPELDAAAHVTPPSSGGEGARTDRQSGRVFVCKKNAGAAPVCGVEWGTSQGREGGGSQACCRRRPQFRHRRQKTAQRSVPTKSRCPRVTPHLHRRRRRHQAKWCSGVASSHGHRHCWLIWLALLPRSTGGGLCAPASRVAGGLRPLAARQARRAATKDIMTHKRQRVWSRRQIFASSTNRTGAPLLVLTPSLRSTHCTLGAPALHGQPPLDRDATNERMVLAVVSSSVQFSALKRTSVVQ